jgi:hypothetical protein
VTYDDVARDDEPNVELAQELLSKCKPLVAGSAHWRYATETRGIPPRAVNYCIADLRALDPPIPGFDRLARGVVSLLRDAKGEVTGLAVEACGPAGERIRDQNGQTARKSYALKKRGQIEAVPGRAAGAERDDLLRLRRPAGEAARGRGDRGRPGDHRVGRAARPRPLPAAGADRDRDRGCPARRPYKG